MKLTPEQMAEARYPDYNYRDMGTHVNAARSGYATCIREEVEPRDETIERLRALVKELTAAGDAMCRWMEMKKEGSFGGFTHAMERNPLREAWVAAKSQGFVPTNTTEG